MSHGFFNLVGNTLRPKETNEIITHCKKCHQGNNQRVEIQNNGIGTGKGRSDPALHGVGKEGFLE